MLTKSEETLHAWFIEHKKTLSFAESCTGGLLSTHMTAMPGASHYFLGSVVVYSNALKEKILKVSPETLSSEGAVSSQTAQEMLIGLFKVTEADFGLAVTGIAGPSGGTLEKPVGTVFYALGEKSGKMEAGSFCAQGNRQTIMLSTTNQLLEKLLNYVMINV
jgi:nicotinamide-nucleotide amidase